MSASAAPGSSVAGAVGSGCRRGALTPQLSADSPPVDPWQSHMRRGNFAAAWEVSDAVLRARRGQPCHHWPRHRQYIWDGTPLAGRRVLVRCYHGLGDTVQFIRYAPLVQAVAREVIVWAQPVLLPLLASVAGIDRLLPLHDGAPEADYDLDVELMELPHIFRTTLETIPNQVPYLSAPSTCGRGALTSHPSQIRKIGLIYQSGGWDDRRSIPMGELAPLLELPEVEWHVLQRGPALADWPEGVGVISGRDRPEELAAVMQTLDLIVSVDSFPAHLAGALGVPVWTLLHADPDWRWMPERGGEDAPWYPTMRLFRQPAPGAWPAVIKRVRSELQARQ